MILRREEMNWLRRICNFLKVFAYSKNNINWLSKVEQELWPNLVCFRRNSNTKIHFKKYRICWNPYKNYLKKPRHLIFDNNCSRRTWLTTQKSRRLPNSLCTMLTIGPSLVNGSKTHRNGTTHSGNLLTLFTVRNSSLNQFQNS